MKKRIMALALCLLVCLPLALTACGSKFVESVSGTKAEDKSSYTTVIKKDIKGLSPELDERFLFTKDVDENNSKKVTYRVYDVITGDEIFKEKVTSDDQEQNSYKMTALTEDLFCLTYTTFRLKDLSKETTCTIYNEVGNIVYDDLEEVPTYISNLAYDAFIFDEELYFYKDGNMSLKKSLKETMVDEALLKSLSVAGDKYVKVTSEKIFVFDSDFKQIDVQTLKSSSEDYYEFEETNYSVLNNGNVLVQVLAVVGAYTDVFDANYDFVMNGACYILDTYLYNTKKLTYKEIKCSYLINEVVTADDYFDRYGTGFVNGADNMADGYKIDNESLVYGVNNEDTIALYISNEGKVEEFEITDEGTSYVALSDTRYIVFGDYFTRLYNEKNEVVGELGSVVAYNKNFIVTKSAVYSTDNCSSVVTFDENTEYVNKTVDSIVYKATDEKNNEVEYRVVSASGTQTVAEVDFDEELGNGVRVNIQVSDYYIAVQATTCNEFTPEEITYSVYTTAGSELESITANVNEGENVLLSLNKSYDNNEALVVTFTKLDDNGVSQELKLFTLAR